MKTSARLSGIATIVAALMLPAGMAGAQQQSKPQLVTNEAMVAEVTRPATFDLKDPVAVLAYVLASLPSRVTVYPTENYYYFKFVHGGVPIAGNLRLDPRDRDQGKIQLGYYEDHAEWKKDGFEQGLELGAREDVLVERVESLVYRVTYKGTSVVFALNDVSQIKPPAGAVGPDERLIGPVFDESAVRFFLVYNTKAKVFHYILDETARVPDALVPSPRSDRLLVGKRTGFAFYRDHRLDRKILVGVFERNVLQNNYFDGPFDQLPDNFIEGETLRQAIVDSDPTVKGQIDRLGYFEGGEARYGINPYMQYRSENDLLAVHRCATDRRVPAAAYYRCFAMDDAGPRTVGRPLALRELRGKAK
ncbi:MAG: hypothetical protein K2Y71_11165 [Xanthobacteraceae bacterium]|nr:hypothetical protein [Xanthobacteraceae bacterium]